MCNLYQKSKHGMIDTCLFLVKYYICVMHKFFCFVCLFVVVFCLCFEKVWSCFRTPRCSKTQSENGGKSNGQSQQSSRWKFCSTKSSNSKEEKVTSLNTILYLRLYINNDRARHFSNCFDIYRYRPVWVGESDSWKLVRHLLYCIHNQNTAICTTTTAVVAPSSVPSLEHRCTHTHRHRHTQLRISLEHTCAHTCTHKHTHTHIHACTHTLTCCAIWVRVFFNWEKQNNSW